MSRQDQLLEIVRYRKGYSENYHQKFYHAVPRRYDFYRGTMRTLAQPFRNNVFIPFLFSVIQSDVARKVQTSFGAWPICTFEGYGPEDRHIAQKNEVLVSAQMKDCSSFVKAVDFFLGADLYGTGVSQVGWRKVVRNERLRMVDPLVKIETVQSRQIVRFDGPDWDPLDIIDFFPQPGKRRIPDMAWVCRRYYLDLSDIEALVAQGVYDEQGLRALRENPGVAPAPPEGQMRSGPYRNYDEWQARLTEKFAKPIEIIEMWGHVPDELVVDGVNERVISMANGTALLRDRPNPYWHGQKPFLSYCPMPDPHYFHGVGKVEIVEKIAMTANKLVNQMLDTRDIFNNPMFIYDRTKAGFQTQSNMYARPAKLLPMDGPVDDSVIRPLIPDLRGVQQTIPDVGALSQWIQMGTGMSEDVVMGLPGPARETARGFLGRQEAALTRIMLEARLAEEGFIEPLANMFRALNRQYLPTPKELRILGTGAQINQITGMPLPPEPVQIDIDDLNMDYDARAVGATQQMGRSVKQQNFVLMLQTLQANPVAMQMINWASMLRTGFEIFEFKNLDELLVQGQIPNVNMQNAQPGAPGMQQIMQPMGNQLEQFMQGGAPLAAPELAVGG